VRKVPNLRRRPRPTDSGSAAAPGRFPPARFAAAWAVHFYTALGLVIAAAIAVLIVRGDGAAYRAAFLLMVAATVVDATDGTLARAAEVKKVLPGFDGRRLDDLTDFLTYTFLPLLLIWRAGVLPGGGAEWAWLVPLLASAYGFCQVEAKTADGFFRGFPSYWNVVALYLYALPFPPAVALAVVLVLAVLTFVPTRYLYPSQRGRLNAVTVALGAVWGVMLIAVIGRLPDEGRPAAVDALTAASLFFPAYYMGASWWVSGRAWRQKR
jgi:phosphatidylcholine synthase